MPVKKPGSLKRHTYKNLLKTLRIIQPDIIHIDEEPNCRAAFQVIFLAKYFLKKKLKIIIFTWENIFKKFSILYRLFERFCFINSAGLVF